MKKLIIFFIMWLVSIFCHVSLFASSAQESLKRLITGNNDYLSGNFDQFDCENESKSRMRLKEHGQRPIAAILTCSDSRVSVERMFNIGLGEIFVVKTAGNIIGKSQIASLEYAVSHLHVPLVVILGHSHCGMSEMALSDSASDGALGEVIQDLRPMVEEVKSSHLEDTAHVLTKKLTNIAKQNLEGSPIISEAILSGKVKVIMGIYDIETGRVQFFDELE